MPPGAPNPSSPSPVSATLAEASRTLWLATLSLMTAFMQMQAPAHRYLLARRIARNLRTLGGLECFSQECRQRFVRLESRWESQARRFKPA